MAKNKLSNKNTESIQNNLWKVISLILFTLILIASILVWALWPSSINVTLIDPSKMIQKVDSVTPFEFTQNIVSDSVLNKLIPFDHITFEPNIEGKYRWIDNDKLQIFPEELLLPATRYQMIIDPEYFNDQGFKWKGGTKYSFETTLLGLSKPIDYKVLSSNADAKIPFIESLALNISFNSSVNPDSLNKYLTISANDQKDIEYKITEIAPTDQFKIIIKELTQSDHLQTLAIYMNKNLTPIRGHLSMLDDIKEIVEINNLIDLVIKSVRPRYSGSTPLIELSINNQIDVEYLQSFIEIVPAVDNYSIKKGYYSSWSKKQEYKIYGNFVAGEYYSFIIKKGLTTPEGSVLSTDFSTRIYIDDLPPNLTFANNGLFLAKNGKHNLGLITLNVEKVDMEVSRIFYNNIVPWTRGYNKRFNANYGDILLKEKMPIQFSKNLEVKTIFNIDKYIGKEKGIYQIKISDSEYRWRKGTQWVVLTDLGIIYKEEYDGLWVFVHSIETTEPVSNVNVRLLSTNNQELFSGTTDTDGRVYFGNYKKTIPDNFTPYMIIAEKDGDLSFARKTISTTDFDVGGRPYLSEGFEAFIYSDRGIYRPGDISNLIGLVRGENGIIPPQQLPVKLVITASDNSSFLEKVFNLNAQGAFETNIKLPDYAITGEYSIQIKVGDDIIGNTVIQVEEFIPDRIKVDINIDSDEIMITDEITGIAKGTTLYGPPASNRKVKIKCEIRSESFFPEKYKSFQFITSERDFSSKEINIIESNLDENGEINFNYQIDENIKAPSSLRGILAATVIESGGRAISQYKTFRIHPYTHYVGIRAIKDNTEISEKKEFQIILLDQEGNSVSSRELTANIYKINWNWNYIVKDGRRRWISEKEETFINSQVLYSEAKPIIFSSIPTDWGNYRIDIIDKESEMMSSMDYWVSGWGSQPWNLNNPDRLEISLDKDSYTPGEEAQVRIEAPFSGRLLITIESDKVLDIKSFVMENNIFSFPVKVSDEYSPNIYVSALVIRSPIGLEEHESVRAFGVAPLTVTPSSKIIKLEMLLPDEIRPQGNLTIEYSISTGGDPAFVTIAAIDEGILQLIDYKTPDPFSYFYGKKRLNINTIDMYSELLPEYNSSTSTGSTGGDTADEYTKGRQKHVSTSGIKRVEPVALWSGLLQPDQNGSGTVSFNIPQFNGSLRVMAVAISGDKYGNNYKTIIVRDPIVITPTLPRFLSGNDNFIIPVEIYNGTGKDGNFDVLLNFMGGVIINGEDKHEVFIADNTQELVLFDATAPVGLKPIKSTVTTTGNGETSIHTVNIPLRPPYPVKTLTGGDVVSIQKPFTFQFPNGWYKNSADHHLIVSVSPELQYSSSLQYLLQYPHGCAEQMVSRLFPLIYFDELAKTLEPELFGVQSVQYYLDEGIKELQSMQLTNGSFSYWRNSDIQYNDITIYVTHFLVEARDAGYKIPNGMLNKSLDWCKQLARSSTGLKYDEKINHSHRVYANYVLALAGDTDPNSIHYLKDFNIDKLKDYRRYQIAFCLHRLGEIEDAYNLIPKSAPIPNLKDEEWKNDAHEYAMMLSVLLDIMPDNHQIPNLIKVLNNSLNSNGRWYNTYQNAYALIGLGKYLKTKKNQEPTEGRIIIEGEKSMNFKQEDVYLNNNDWAGKNVEIIVDKGESAFAYWISSGLPLTSSYSEQDNDMRIRRQFFDDEGNKLDKMEFLQGKLYLVKITLETLSESLGDVIIVDMLPSGLEVENARLESQKNVGGKIEQLDKPRYIDFRDDRIIIAANTVHKDKPPISYHYNVRAVTKGEFTLPPITAESMYDPVKSSTSSSGKIIITD